MERAWSCNQLSLNEVSIKVCCTDRPWLMSEVFLQVTSDWSVYTMFPSCNVSKHESFPKIWAPTELHLFAGVSVHCLKVIVSVGFCGLRYHLNLKRWSFEFNDSYSKSALIFNWAQTVKPHLSQWCHGRWFTFVRCFTCNGKHTDEWGLFTVSWWGNI